MNLSARATAAMITLSLLALNPSMVQALGLGRASTRAVLGETLGLTVPVRLEPGEQVSDECLSADVYFGDDKLDSSVVSAVMLPIPLAPPQATPVTSQTLLVRTTALINEPVVTVYLSAGCEARITRKFVALADPPSNAATPAQAATVVIPQPIESRDLPRVSATPGARPASQQKVSALGRSRHEDQPRAKVRRAASAPAAVATTPSSRLQLDPLEADALVTPDLRTSIAMNAEQVASAQTNALEVQARRDAAAALWRALNTSPQEQLREQQRLKELETRLAQLHAEGEQTRQNLALIQTRMHEIEADRPAAYWLYAFGGLALAALGLALYLYTQLRRKERQHDEWWPQHMMPPETTEPLQASLPEKQDAAIVTPVLQPPPFGDIHMPLVVSTPDASHPDLVAKAMASASTKKESSLPTFELSENPPGPPEHLRPVSVEELIDLEQQAEFFVVLGQDEAAIDLLEAHIQSTDGTIPLPFLKLLEIYHRLGRRSDYERVQAAFNTHFNGYAPTWDADLQHGHDLTDYPGIIDRLQALWSTPSRAMEVLEMSLIRPHAQAETFDLPAYRELLFLYAIARDLADKLHPSDELTSVPMPLMATRPVSAAPEMRPDLGVDLRLEELPATSSRITATAGLPPSHTPGGNHPH
jgi:pilus assembly protein FimV